MANAFSIQHYAGAIVYDATDFVRKNADTIPVDLIELGRKSNHELISNAFPAEPVDKAKTSRRGSSLVANTVWTKFRNQLSDLMTDLSMTDTRYIRCIKPNTRKLPEVVEHPSTIEQLRCAGVVAAVTISRAAFPNRLLSSAVVARFGCLGKGGADATALLEGVLGDKAGFEVGATKIYFRSSVLENLEQVGRWSHGKRATCLCRL